MNKRLLALTIALGVIFIGSLVTFIVFANLTPRTDAPPVPPTFFDSDLDGLTDAEENQLGTNPSEADSDFDGLSDLEEINIYKTLPLVADTDADGFIDGVEVRGGFDPLAPPPTP